MGSDTEYYWNKVTEQNTILPCSRWHHSANAVGDGRIIIFGGFSSSKTQKYLNDIWILDTKTDKWLLPCDFKSSDEEKNDEINCTWNKGLKRQEPPPPRGSHSACIVDNFLIIFGGYGGSGYSRRDFNDMFALCLKTFVWFTVNTNGNPPCARSAHKCVHAKEKIYVMGGWDTSEQFDDVFVLDKSTLSWSKIESASGPESWGPRRWNFSAVSVFAVPYWKIFVFGGNSGNLDQSRPQGYFRNDIQVLECIFKDDNIAQTSWSRPPVVGNIPSPRSDTEMIYSSDTGKLILFGGWSNKWFGDINCCDVKEVVGPPYNVFSIQSLEWESAIGPVTGNSQMILKGKGFKSSCTTSATIRFACMKGSIEVQGDILNDEEVSLKTPNFEKYGPLEVEVKLKLSSQPYSNGVAKFSYFAVTDARKTLAFGPGILPGIAPFHPTSFIIQAKDRFSNDRTCGMDKFDISISSLGLDDSDDTDSQNVPFSITDKKNGAYIIHYTPPSAGKFHISINFCGTFRGRRGPIRGSPFISEAFVEASVSCNDLNGKLLQECIRMTTNNLKSFSNATTKGLSKAITKDDIKNLISVKEHLRNVKQKTKEFEISISSNLSALRYMKKNGLKVPSLEKLMKDLDTASNLWSNTKTMAPLSANRIESIDKIWVEKTKFKIEAYERELKDKLEDFRKLQFWTYTDSSGTNNTTEAAMNSIQEAEKDLMSEMRILDENSYLCALFHLDGHIDESKSIADEMKRDLKEMRNLWNASEELHAYIESSEAFLWSNLDLEILEEGGKSQLKSMKALHKCTRWSDAFISLDKLCKNFLSTIPLITLLRAKSMRPRHWKLLIKATNADSFIPPCDDENIRLGGLLALDLHKISNEVEEICDQANKEDKMEKTLEQIESRWTGIVFTMSPYKGDDEDIPILGIEEEDFESLENDQLVIQGMLASRFVAQFRNEVNSWHKALLNVNEVFLLISEIQRTWSYLEPLFLHSDEVKRELPEDATRFASIDVNVRTILKKAWRVKNVKAAFNQKGLFEKLENIQEQLDLCKKSLADFLDGRRRQFPRYYFVSEADLLDILSNGSRPEKILQHIPKVYLCTKSLTLSKNENEGGRPIATEFIAGVGSEVCAFEPPIQLEGKVEIYMQTILDAQKLSIFKTVQRSLLRYRDMLRPDWILSKNSETGRPNDPAQTTLLVLAINYVQEVENRFVEISNGNRSALQEYSKKQVAQLNELIKLTQSNLTKGDRTKVMVCITMDAHARDIVENMIRNKVDSVDSFMWQSQLKHKFRVSPPHARYQERDSNLRGDRRERVEIAICDAILPYDYEYLGNGPRLVITPLTDRVYVTATQALNLKMGCAPAGPAGTGKTETTKDLANALAKLIYVINCKSFL